MAGKDFENNGFLVSGKTLTSKTGSTYVGSMSFDLDEIEKACGGKIVQILIFDQKADSSKKVIKFVAGDPKYMAKSGNTGSDSGYSKKQEAPKESSGNANANYDDDDIPF